MRTVVVLILCAATLTAGCARLRDAVHPACTGRPDAADCDAALQAASEAVDLEGDAIEVAPVSCDASGCSTWVSARPGSGECRPLYEVEVVKATGGRWTVGMITHGDPPCAFQ